MQRQQRIKGGEKNTKSGQRWTREELSKVLELYIADSLMKIHESNPAIRDCANKIGRTTRSVEAQLLMFRALDKLGNYGYKNMNKLSKALWKEYVNKNLK
jgi:hypothetical protein